MANRILILLSDLMVIFNDNKIIDCWGWDSDKNCCLLGGNGIVCICTEFMK